MIFSHKIFFLLPQLNKTSLKLTGLIPPLLNVRGPKTALRVLVNRAGCEPLHLEAVLYICHKVSTIALFWCLPGSDLQY